MLYSARASAKQRGLLFDLKVSDIELVSHCPVLGLKLDYSIRTKTGKRLANSPSLDRIIPKLGYIKGNVMVISWRANSLKGNASLEELRLLGKFYGGLDV